jgi:hypothetical protein
MQELVKAAAEIASRYGTPIVVVGAPANGNGAGMDATARAHAEATIKGLTDEVQMLRGKIVEAEKLIHQAGTTASGKGPDATPIMAENAQLKAKIGELQGLISSLQAKTGATNGTAAPGAFVDCPLDVLGLEAGVVKKIQKMTINSVGALHTAFLAGNVYAKTTEKPDGKFTKDEVLDIAKALMGKVPHAHGGPQATASAAPGAVQGGPPPGIVDITWEERIKRCRTKEGHIADGKKLHIAAQSELTALSKTQTTPEALNAARAKVQEAETNVRLLDKQLLGMLFFCGFDVKKAQTVDGCLAAHGVMAGTPAGV